MPEPPKIDWLLVGQCYAVSVSTSLGLLCLSDRQHITLRTLIGTFLLYGGMAAGWAAILNENFAGTNPGACFGSSALIGAGVITVPALSRFVVKLLRGALNDDASDSQG